jgi:hypothetical protein
VRTDTATVRGHKSRVTPKQVYQQAENKAPPLPGFRSLPRLAGIHLSEAPLGFSAAKPDLQDSSCEDSAGIQPSAEHHRGSGQQEYRDSNSTSTADRNSRIAPTQHRDSDSTASTATAPQHHRDSDSRTAPRDSNNTAIATARQHWGSGQQKHRDSGRQRDRNSRPRQHRGSETVPGVRPSTSTQYWNTALREIGGSARQGQQAGVRPVVTPRQRQQNSTAGQQNSTAGQQQHRDSRPQQRQHRNSVSITTSTSISRSESRVIEEDRIPSGSASASPPTLSTASLPLLRTTSLPASAQLHSHYSAQPAGDSVSSHSGVPDRRKRVTAGPTPKRVRERDIEE